MRTYTVPGTSSQNQLVSALKSKEQEAWLAAELQRVMAEKVPG
ncbi:MAG TPA: hypothetical protein VEY88_17380 [Archangium sp.]|nr:hypothetical protein [Archangium sp.]